MTSAAAIRPDPTFADVLAAAARLQGRVVRTPVMRSRSLDQRSGAQVFLKCENLQRAGAFKFRGAMNRLLQFTPEERRAGVVAFSSGNHAQAVALAARELGIDAVLVMPSDAPRAKRDAVRDFGGHIDAYDRAREDREARARDWVEREGRVLVPPFDDAAIIAGQGTAVLELLEEAPDLDAIVTPVGGGGLASGSALAAHGRNPAIAVYGVEPETAADVKLSLERGAITPVPHNPTIADGLRPAQPSALTFRLMQRHLAGVTTVSDVQLIEALRLLLFRLKILAEPSGAAGVAAAMAGALPGRRVGIVISGGNIDADVLAGFLL